MEKLFQLVGNKKVETTIEEIVKKGSENDFFYFHRDSSYALLKDLQDRLEEEGFQIGTFREVKFGLDETNYLYELHIL